MNPSSKRWRQQPKINMFPCDWRCKYSKGKAWMEKLFPVCLKILLAHCFHFCCKFHQNWRGDGSQQSSFIYFYFSCTNKTGGNWINLDPLTHLILLQGPLRIGFSFIDSRSSYDFSLIIIFRENLTKFSWIFTCFELSRPLNVQKLLI